MADLENSRLTLEALQEIYFESVFNSEVSEEELEKLGRKLKDAEKKIYEELKEQG